MGTPMIHYAHSGDIRIAYQVVGNGPIDLVFVPGFISNLEVHWEDPGYNHLIRRLSAFTRLIMFDKRGTGLSDRVDATALPSLETRMDDVRAVMDAAGSGRAALLGASEGAPMAALAAPATGHEASALMRLNEKAQMVSTRPELPVSSWTSPTIAIRADSGNATAATASRTKTSKKNSAKCRRATEHFEIRPD